MSENSKLVRYRKFINAVREGNLSQIEKETDISSWFEQGLLDAFQYKHFEIADYLIQQGADINVGDDRILYECAFGGNVEVVREILKRGGSLSSNKWSEVLRFTAGYDPAKTVEYIIKQGGDVNPALQIAIKHNRSRTFDVLVRKYNADVHRNFSLQHVHVNAVKFLLQHF